MVNKNNDCDSNRIEENMPSLVAKQTWEFFEGNIKEKIKGKAIPRRVIA